jgi:flavin-binding protein dodecin
MSPRASAILEPSRSLSGLPGGGADRHAVAARPSNRDSPIADDVTGILGRILGSRAWLPAGAGHAEGGRMSVAKVSEISSTSSKSFEDALQQGLNRAAKTLRNIRGAWVKEQHVRCEGGRITEYQVNMMVTFVLDD